MLHGGDRTAAAALLIGLAVSILPILLRVLPPLRRDIQTGERPRYVVVTIVGVLVYDPRPLPVGTLILAAIAEPLISSISATAAEPHVDERWPTDRRSFRP